MPSLAARASAASVLRSHDDKRGAGNRVGACTQQLASRKCRQPLEPAAAALGPRRRQATRAQAVPTLRPAPGALGQMPRGSHHRKTDHAWGPRQATPKRRRHAASQASAENGAPPRHASGSASLRTPRRAHSRYRSFRRSCPPCAIP
eukprot:4381245-Prymnesium_polylepis.1